MSVFFIYFFSYLLLTITIYSILTSFVGKSKKLKDPFEEK